MTAPKEQTSIDVFRTTVQRMTPEFKAALPPQIPVERFIRTTITAVQMAPALLEADRRSLLAAAMRAAQDGLLPDGREAAFVIFKSKGGPSVVYMPMIGGLLKKVRNSGEIASISTHVAYSKDLFRYVLGDEEKIEHVPTLSADRGEPIAAYAIAHTKDGAIYREVMSVEQIEQVRKVSRAKDDGPWVEWWDEMARKTVFRRLQKRLPSSADLEQALAHDNDALGFVQVPAPPLLDAADPAPARAAERGPSRARAMVAQATAGAAPSGDAPAEAAADAPG